eukprot:scaffold265394_cov30-Tisochrysis_lutea.AAC.2
MLFLDASAARSTASKDESREIVAASRLTARAEARRAAVARNSDQSARGVVSDKISCPKGVSTLAQIRLDVPIKRALAISVRVEGA